MKKLRTHIKAALLLLAGACASAQACMPISYSSQDAHYFPGSYSETCTQCHFSPRTAKLSCECQDRNQDYRPTHLRLHHNCLNIENINGHLRCTRFTHRAPSFGPIITRSINAGPIWSNDDAQQKCRTTCGDFGGHWDGNWRTLDTGTSTCDCQYRHVFS